MFRRRQPVESEDESVARPPGPLERLLIPSSLLAHSLRGMQGYAPLEGVCCWFGRELEPGVGIAMVVAFPRIYSTERSFHLLEGQMGHLATWAARQDVWLLAQVHSHPADEPHSEADEAWSASWREGLLSVIFPFSAQLSTLRQPHWRVYECDALRRWQEIDSGRLQVFDDIWLPKE